MAAYTQKRILIIIGGGTITGNVAKGSVVEAIKSTSDDFMSIVDKSIAVIKKNWNILVDTSIIELFNVDSSNIQPKHRTQLIETIQKNYNKYDAFLILHGTNTMGYTASALSFGLANINKPVILTGSQVPLGYLGSDATINIVNALRLSVREYHDIKGVIVVFGSKIISGVRTKKGTDFSYDSFWSFQQGFLGEIGRFIKINREALQKHISYLSRKYPLAIQSKILQVYKDFDTEHIASLTEFPGMSINIFQSLVENNNIKAFIFRTFGAGDPSSHLFPAFEYLKQKQIPIIITTQTHNGHANFQVNESGQHLKEHDLAIPAYDMSIESMTIKMGWLLAQGLSYEQIKIKMLEDLYGEICVENELI